MKTLADDERPPESWREVFGSLAVPVRTICNAAEACKKRDFSWLQTLTIDETL